MQKFSLPHKLTAKIAKIR